MFTPIVQIYAQAYMTYEDKVMLLRIARSDREGGYLWLPIGGHVVREVGKTRVIHDPQQLLTRKIDGYSADYELFNIGGSYLVDTDSNSFSEKGNLHFNLVYYGRFYQPPPEEMGAMELFDFFELRNLQSAGTLEDNVAGFCQKAIRLNMFLHGEN
jgi:hypothetical protein